MNKGKDITCGNTTDITNWGLGIMNREIYGVRGWGLGIMNGQKDVNVGKDVDQKCQKRSNANP